MKLVSQTKEDPKNDHNMWIDVVDKRIVIQFKAPVDSITLSKSSVMEMANIIMSRLSEIE